MWNDFTLHYIYIVVNFVEGRGGESKLKDSIFLLSAFRKCKSVYFLQIYRNGKMIVTKRIDYHREIFVVE